MTVQLLIIVEMRDRYALAEFFQSSLSMERHPAGCAPAEYPAWRIAIADHSR